MQRFQQFIILFFCLPFFCGCENTTYQSSVPAYPVHAVIDTRTLFVDFLPENTNAYVTVNQEGYKENGRFVSTLNVTDAYGFGGLLVYVSVNGYVAFDLACPYCAARGTKSPCIMDGIFAECPLCGERYEIASGYAVPQRGISKETLRPLNINRTEGKLTITQMP